MKEKGIITDMRKRMEDIQFAISWRELANTYFTRSCSWLYHKLDGIDGNGGVGGFSPQEAEQLRGALCDLADRIRRAADSIPTAEPEAEPETVEEQAVAV